MQLPRWVQSQLPATCLLTLQVLTRDDANPESDEILDALQPLTMMFKPEQQVTISLNLVVHSINMFPAALRNAVSVKRAQATFNRLFKPVSASG